eukprot:11195250-Lingulodinium_polyedra.AAC.1
MPTTHLRRATPRQTGPGWAAINPKRGQNQPRLNQLLMPNQETPQHVNIQQGLIRGCAKHASH